MPRSAVRGGLVGVVTYVALVPFRLWWFLIPVVLVGAVVALLVSVWSQRGSQYRALAGVVAILSYAVVTSVLIWAVTDQKSYRTFEATWHDRGADNRTGQSEVFLAFIRFPGHGVGIYSDDLRDHLASLDLPITTVEFELTSDNWCLRGIREVRIGNLTDLSPFLRAGGYSRGSDTPSPWEPAHWWCW